MDLYFKPWLSDLLQRVFQRQQGCWLTPSMPLSAARSPPVLCGQLPLSSAHPACSNHSAKREGTWLHFSCFAQATNSLPWSYNDLSYQGVSVSPGHKERPPLQRVWPAAWQQLWKIWMPLDLLQLKASSVPVTNCCYFKIERVLRDFRNLQF